MMQHFINDQLINSNIFSHHPLLSYDTKQLISAVFETVFIQHVNDADRIKQQKVKFNSSVVPGLGP